MKKIRSILVALSHDERAPKAIARAVAIARALGARVDLFVCESERAYFLQHEYDRRSASAARQSCMQEALRSLDGLWSAHGAPDVAVTFDAACESPLYQGIVHKVQQAGSDLVLRPIRELDGNQGRALDASDWELVRTCPAPLLLARGRHWSNHAAIAAAVDISGDERADITQAVIGAAELFRERFAGTLELLYGAAGATGAETSAAKETPFDLLARRAREAGAHPTQLHVVVGDTAQVLPGFAAARHYELMVLGALAHRESLTALVGTFTGRLLEMLDCDFLLVKPAGYRSPVA